MFDDVYRNRRVLVTGHTGFKGSWLCLWLARLGAQVTGYALPPLGDDALFVAGGIAGFVDHRVGDVRDAAHIGAVVAEVRPEVIFHLAAQPLVLASYEAPVATFDINVMGSIHVMEAVRAAKIACQMVMVTTDKVYRNHEWAFAYRENDALGGHDPYSASKAAMEIAVASWRAALFSPAGAADNGVRIATARAGNVVGGGDWSDNRIIPDLARAFAAGRPGELRNPGALRPWQHVLEPLAGYLQLGARLIRADGAEFADAWNFGPLPSDTRSAGELAAAMGCAWGMPDWVDMRDPAARHEAGNLRLAIDKATGALGWQPVWGFDRLVARTAGWYRRVLDDPGAARGASEADLDAYVADARAIGAGWCG